MGLRGASICFAHLIVSCGLGEQPFTRSHHSGELQNSSTATLHNQSHMCRFGHCVTDTFLTARPHELRCELPPPFHYAQRQRLASASSPHIPSSGNASLTSAHANPGLLRIRLADNFNQMRCHLGPQPTVIVLPLLQRKVTANQPLFASEALRCR